MPVWSRAQGEQVLQEIHQIPTLPKSPSPFPLAESLNSSPDPTKVPRPPHLLENVELKKLPGLIWSSVRDEAENPRDWRGAAQSTTGWSLAAWSKRVTAGQGLSPARLRCPRCHQPCLAFHPAPGMAQEASPQHLLGKVDFPATLLHPACPLPGSNSEPPALFSWVSLLPCRRQEQGLSPGIASVATKTSRPPADQRASCQGAQSSLSQQSSFLPSPDFIML